MSLELQKVPLRQVQDVRQLLMNEQARNQLSAVAAKHMNPERMMRVVANAIRTTPKLQDCEPMSFLGALMQCAALGLEPNTILGHAYLIPFEKSKKITNAKGVVEWVKIPEVQLVVGYKGLIDLARRSGHITSLSANIHYEDDELWDYEEGTEARLRHRAGPQAGKKLHAYAIAKFRDGGHAYVVLPWSHVMKIRDGSQGYQNAKKQAKLADTPWVKHEDEMAKKTAIRALAKYLPLSVEFMEAMDVDEARADFRTFAIDPTAGVTREDDDAAIEGEAIEADQVEDKKPEQAKPAQKAKEEPKAEPEKAKAEAPVETKPEPEKTDTPVARRPAEETADQADNPKETQEEAPATDDASTDAASEASTITADQLLADPRTKTVLNDALDLGETAARGVHRAALDSLQEQDPEIFAALDAELKHIGG